MPGIKKMQSAGGLNNGTNLGGNVGTCALCDTKNVALAESHLIPKFVYDWIKNTSINGYLRYSDDVNKREQDGPKEYLLCADCEGRLGTLEKELASRLFKKIANYRLQKSEVLITNNVRLAVLSIFWRTMITAKHRQDDRTDEDNRLLDEVIGAWKAQIRDGVCKERIYFAPFYGEPPYFDIDVAFNYFLERGVGCQDVRFGDDPHGFFAVFKLPFMFFYMVSDSWTRVNAEKSTELAEGALSVDGITGIPDILRRYINQLHSDFERLKLSLNRASRENIARDFEKAKSVTGAHKSIARSKPKPGE
ncbi:hypothetical protein [Dyella thiooxydans]|uniref:hypothetical protein n=1 Tax=Dyella thiooxydans TaxID=445710 RepID=UPI0012FB4E75|nr:hypothetical protein [Dyella thiooxydans]